MTFDANVSNNQSFIVRIYNDAVIENSEIIELQIVVTTTGDAIVSTTTGTYTLTVLDANFIASNILYENFENGGIGNFSTQGQAGSDLFQNGNTATASSQFWIIEPTNNTQFAYTNDDACDCDKSNDILTSPIFSLAGITGDVFFEFDHAFSAETYEIAEVEINIGGGWENLVTLTNTSPNNNNTLTTPWVIGNQILLTPYIGQNNVQIRFTYNDAGNWAYGLAVDNIRVFSDAPVNASGLTGTDIQATCGAFTWIDGNTYTESNSIATYTITGGAANGCDSIVTLDLTISNAVNGTDTQATCGAFTWIDGNTYTESNSSAAFTIIGGATNGCDSIVTLDLTISNVVNGTDTQATCGAFTWIDGNTYTESNSTATYTITGGAANGCDSIVTLDLIVFIVNNVNAGQDISVCEGENVTLSANGSNSYSWDGGIIDGVSFTPNVGITEYTVTGIDINGCQSTASIYVNVYPQPMIEITSINPICSGDDSGEISIEISGGTEPYTIQWAQNESISVLQNLAAGTYSVVVLDDAGCEATESTTLINPIEPCYEITEVNLYAPNSFTPDGDENNQNWFLVLSGIDEFNFSLKLYNRWGEIIWESHDISAKWDGTFKNKTVQNGTYTWQVEYTRLSDGKKIFETGHLNVIR